MALYERAAEALSGMYRDVLRDAYGQVLWDRGWRKNAIVVDCHRLLAAFMRGNPTTVLGIQGLQVGAGNPVWDQSPPLPPNPSQTALVDPQPFTVPLSAIKIDFLDGGNVASGPTNAIQIIATLAPNMPNPSRTLREFGLVGQLNGNTVLINYVTHTAIAKDPASTLERTIWLTF